MERVVLPIPTTACEALATYCQELERWNQKINLTSLVGSNLVRRLVVEPIWIAEDLKIAGNVVDIGSGNGSPAIPIRLYRPLTHLHLVETRSRRAAFLRHLKSTLALKNVDVHRTRFED